MTTDLRDIGVAVLTGFLSGLMLAVPVGPVNLTILNEGARRGFRWALLIGLGSSCMEVLYCAVAFTGPAALLQGRFVRAAMELFSFVFLLYLGLRFMLARSVAAPTRLLPADKHLEERFEARIGQRLHPHSAFMIGFVRTLANPGVLLCWIILAVNFMSRGWVPTSASGKLACVTGVALGTGLWFAALSWAVSLGHKKLSEQTLVRIERGSGAVLLVLALLHGGHISLQLARHRL